MRKLDNAYDVVNKWLTEGKHQVSENEINEYQDSAIILALLKSKYNAKYREPEDFHFCGTYSFENPLIKKHKCYILYYSFFNSNIWEPHGQAKTEDEDCHRICREIIRLDMNGTFNENDKMEISKKLFHYIMGNKIYVGESRFWKITVEERY